MPSSIDKISRRLFVRLAGDLAVVAAGAALTGCGGKEQAPVPSPTPSPAMIPPITSTAPSLPGGDQDSLNFALNIEYIGAQFYGYAANGLGLPASLVAGLGEKGQLSGGRKANLTDPVLARCVAGLADDKLAHVTRLREQLSKAAAAQPEVDLSTGVSSAFSIAAQMAGIVPPGTAFDPFSGDEGFLLGAFILEDRTAAVYRSLVSAMSDSLSVDGMYGLLADAICHGGVIRSMLSSKAAANSALGTSMMSVSALLARLDGGGHTDSVSAASEGASIDISDKEGISVPFVRTRSQILNILYLNAAGARNGGFLPHGINAVQG